MIYKGIFIIHLVQLQFSSTWAHFDTAVRLSLTHSQSQNVFSLTPAINTAGCDISY